MVTNQLSYIDINVEIYLMKKIPRKTLVVSIIGCMLISSIGIYLQNFEIHLEKYPLGLSSSDSWLKFVKEEGRFYRPDCELVNGSLYVIGKMNLEDNTNEYLYVSNFNTSGIKEWEHLIKLDDYTYISYLFDDDNNLFVLNIDYSSEKILLIKLNSSGALLFSKELSIDPYIIHASLVLGENNSLLIFGNYFYPYPGRLFIMKFSNAGQFLWNTSIYMNDYSPDIVKDSGYNMYLYFSNNSIYYLAKINSSGAIVWQMGLENKIQHLIIDSNNNLFIMGDKSYSTGFILKINSNGNQIKELLIENFRASDGKIWYLNDLLVFNKYSMSILCYDLNLDQKWSFSLSDYITPHFYLQTFLAKDSHDNVYIIQNNELGNINLVKISSTGEFLSKTKWGGNLISLPRSLIIDLDNNIYFLSNCEYYDVWRERYSYTVLVKNPANGGIPPVPKRNLDLRDYTLFSAVGIACLISLIALLSIIGYDKKRIS